MKNEILIVDDDKNMLKILSKCLAEGGYSVSEAETSEEALKILKTLSPELIIADVMMPGMNGFELCREVRSSGNAETPFIFCTALGSLPERIKGLWIGADDYIVKPINSTELLLKVEKLIEKSRKLAEMAKKATGAQGIMSGKLDNIKVAEMLQILNFMGLPNISFRIEATGGRQGEIYIEKKCVTHAQAGELTGMKAFSRILGWSSGTYVVENKTWTGKPTISGLLEERLFEGATQLDEFSMLHEALSEMGDCLRIKYGPDLAGRHFEEKVSKVLRIIHKNRELQKVLDLIPLTDLESIRIISELCIMGVVEIFPGKSKK